MSVVAQSEPESRNARPRVVVVSGSSTARKRAADDEKDPIAAILVLGDRAVRVGVAIGLVVALATHGWVSARAIGSLYDLLHATQRGREVLHEYFWATYDIEINKEKKVEDKPEEPPPPPPEPEPAPKQIVHKAPDDPYDQPKPAAPAQAAKVLTRDADPNDKIEDMTNTVVSGDGTASFGLQSAAGIGSAPVTAHAVVGGVPGGRGTATVAPKAAPPPTGPDLSRPPGLVGGSGGNWNCPFPAEADGDSIDRATAVISVTVKPDGSPASVAVVSDPGHGFGREARKCALGRRYSPALDHDGQAITATTPPIKVNFTR